MSINDCIQRAVDAGEVRADKAEIAKEQFLKLEAQHRADGLSPEEASSQAALDLAEQTSRDVIDSKFARLHQLHRNKVNADALKKHRNHRGELDPADAITQFVEHNGTAKFRNVNNEEQVLLERYNDTIAGVLKQFNLNAFGRGRNRAKFENVVRELSGESTGDAAAREASQAVRTAMEQARNDFNNAGGSIGLIENYDLPHTHSRQKVLSAQEGEWVGRLMDDLDWTKIENPKTRFPFTSSGVLSDAAQADAREFLEEIHEAIRTDNWSRKEPSMVGGAASLRSSRAHPRTLHFKDADTWMAYNREFGDQDLFTTMMNHLQGMARDTALMRVLGPNPKGGLTFLQQTAEKTIKEAEYPTVKARIKAEERLTAASALSRNMLAQLDGSAHVAAHPTHARFLAGTRQVLTSIQLGSAALSAVSDYGTIGLQTAEFGGSGSRAITRALRLYNPANKSDRALASKLGLVADHLATVTNSAARFTGETMTGGLAERLPHMTMRLSGLSQMTSMHRMAVKTEFMGVLGEARQQAFADIHPYLKDKLERGGITADEWETIRKVEPIHAENGHGGFLVPDHIRTSGVIADEDAADALATKLHTVMMQQQELAVPSSSIRGRSHIVGSTAAGSVGGELLRSASMYKSFALSILFNQILGRLRRMPPGRRGKEIAKFLAVSTLLGGVAIQLKEIAKGRDTQPIDNVDYWRRAGFQGGGLGIFGDLIVSEQSRSGGGLAETLSGPVVGIAGDIIGIPSAGLADATKDKDTNYGRQVTQTLRQNTPVLSSLWYVRAAYDRMVMDGVQDLLDPEADKARRRSAKRRQRDYGNAAWWQDGRPLPSRAPDFSNVVGGN